MKPNDTYLIHYIKHSILNGYEISHVITVLTLHKHFSSKRSIKRDTQYNFIPKSKFYIVNFYVTFRKLKSVLSWKNLQITSFRRSHLALFTSNSYITFDGKFSLSCSRCVISCTVLLPKGNTFLILYLDKNDLSPLFALKGSFASFFFF